MAGVGSARRLSRPIGAGRGVPASSPGHPGRALCCSQCPAPLVLHVLCRCGAARPSSARWVGPAGPAGMVGGRHTTLWLGELARRKRQAVSWGRTPSASQLVTPLHGLQPPIQTVLLSTHAARPQPHIAALQAFSTAATGVFGSGWAWLSYDPRTKKLKIQTTPNQVGHWGWRRGRSEGRAGLRQQVAACWWPVVGRRGRGPATLWPSPGVCMQDVLFAIVSLHRVGTNLQGLPLPPWPTRTGLCWLPPARYAGQPPAGSAWHPAGLPHPGPGRVVSSDGLPEGEALQCGCMRHACCVAACLPHVHAR